MLKMSKEKVISDERWRMRAWVRSDGLIKTHFSVENRYVIFNRSFQRVNPFIMPGLIRFTGHDSVIPSKQKLGTTRIGRNWMLGKKEWFWKKLQNYIDKMKQNVGRVRLSHMSHYWGTTIIWEQSFRLKQTRHMCTQRINRAPTFQNTLPVTSTCVHIQKFLTNLREIFMKIFIYWEDKLFC